jgi:tetratricopeptide (TPR) repeat protein
MFPRSVRVSALIVLPLSLCCSAYPQQDPKAPPPQVVTTIQVQPPPEKPDYSKEGVIVEKLSTSFDFNADGTGTKIIELDARVQSSAAVQQLGVLSFTYASGNERIVIDYLRVRKPDGAIVSTPPSDAQDMPTDVTRAAPFYSDLKQLQIPVKSLSAGDELQYRIHFELYRPEIDNQFWGSGDWLPGNVVLDESIELSFPAAQYVQVLSPAAPPAVSESNGRKIYTWNSAQLKPTSEKPPTPDPDALPAVSWTTFHNWQEIGNWYRQLAKDRTTVTPEIQSQVQQLLQGKTTDDEKMQAIYNYVSLQIRYIGVAFGIGRYQPHAADVVLQNQYGDCKDKDTLLRTMLKAAGFDAWPALIPSSHKLHPELPSPQQFDHVITVVPRGDSVIWLDSTPEVAPWKMLLFGIRDKQALVIPTTGDPKLMRTPADGPFPFTTAYTAKAKLDSEGTLTGHLSFSMRGDAEVLLRGAFRATPRAQWQQLTQTMSQSMGYAGDVSNIDVSRPDQTDEPFHMAWDYDRKEYADWSNRRILPLMTGNDLPPAGDPGKPTQLPAKEVETFHSEIELPSQYTAVLPTSVNYVTPWATYESTYKLVGNTFMTDRTVQILASSVPADSLDKYKDFVDKVSTDSGQYVQLVPAISLSAAPDAHSSAPVTPSVPDNADARSLIAAANDELTYEDYPAARRLLQQAEKANPQQEGLWADYARLDLAEKQMNNAQDALRREIQYHPENRGIYRLLYELQIHNKQPDDAIATLEQLLKVAPGDTSTALQVSSLLIDRQRYSDAVSLLRDEMQHNPSDRNLAVQEGRAEILAGKGDSALAALRASIDDADDPKVLSGTAVALADHSLDLPLAESIGKRAVDLAEKQTAGLQLATVNLDSMHSAEAMLEAWDALGWVYFHEQKLNLANAYARAAWTVSLNAGTGDHFAQISEKEGHLQDAVNTWFVAASSEPANSSSPVRTRGLAREKALVDKGYRPKYSSAQDLRSMTFPMVGKQYASADFYVLLFQGHATDVLFISGDTTLKPAADMLRKADYSAQFPEGSAGKLIRRGTLSCSQWTKHCQLFLFPLFTSLPD